MRWPRGAGHFDTWPRIEKYRVVKKDVRLRCYGVEAYGRHAGFVSKLRLVVGQIGASEAGRTALWALMLEWAPWERVLQGDVPFDGAGGLGEGYSLGVLDTADLRGQYLRFEWLKITDHKGIIFMGDREDVLAEGGVKPVTDAERFRSRLSHDIKSRICNMNCEIPNCPYWCAESPLLEIGGRPHHHRCAVHRDMSTTMRRARLALAHSEGERAA